MRPRHLLLIATALLLSTPLAAQEENEQTFRPGRRLIPFAAYEYGAPLSISREPGAVNIPRFNSDGRGSSFNNTGIFGVELAFPSQINHRFGYALQISVAQGIGGFSSNPFPASFGTVDRTSGLPVATESIFEVETNETQGRLSVGLLYDRLGFRFYGGPWIGYRATASVTTFERIVSPDNALYEGGDGGRERVISGGDPITSPRVRYGLSLRVSRNFPLTRHLALTPFLGIRADGGALLNDGLGLRALQARVGLGFSAVLRDSVEETPQAIPPPRSFPLVDLFDADLNGEERGETLIRRGEIVQTLYVECPRAIPSNLTPPTPPERFHPEDLSALPLEEVLQEIPNIIGHRLQSDTLLRLTIGFGSSEEEPLSAYLIEGWGIDRERVTVMRGPDIARGTIQLTGNSPLLFDPLLLERRVEVVEGSTIRLRKSVIDPGAEESWEVVLRRDGEEFASFTSSDEQTGYRVDPGEIETGSGIVTAEMTLHREDGTAVRDADTIRYRREEIPTRHETTWVLFEDPTRNPFKELGTTEPERSVTAQLFQQMINEAIGRGEEITLQSSRPYDTKSEPLIRDLLIARNDSLETGAEITIGVLPTDHPLRETRWPMATVVTAVDRHKR